MRFLEDVFPRRHLKLIWLEDEASACERGVVDLEPPEPKPELNFLSESFRLFGQRVQHQIVDIQHFD